jgi:signal peptidase I
VPAALALVATRVLFPASAEVSDGPLRVLARLGVEHPLVLAVFFFVLASALARHWRAYLPGVRALPAAAPASVSSLVVPAAAAALLALLLRAAVGSPFHVASASMLPTLRPGDEILVSKLAFRAAAPRRGEVIVFRRTPEMGDVGPADLVKRVIGLPGDRVEVRQGQLLLNDWPVPRCDAGVYPHLVADETTLGRLTVEFLEGQAYLTFLTPFARPFPRFTVPPGELFVLGDNRHQSADSRAWNDGRGAGVPLSAVEGRVWRLLASRDRAGRIDLRTLLDSLGRDVYLPGMDVAPLVRGIERCLESPPPSSPPL